MNRFTSDFKETDVTIGQLCSPSVLSMLVKIAGESEEKPFTEPRRGACNHKGIGGTLVADDHVARSTARLVQVETRGSGYLRGKMFQEGLISKEEAVRRVTEMRKAGSHLSEDHYRTVLNYLRTL